jgi:hypothetical protein
LVAQAVFSKHAHLIEFEGDDQNDNDPARHLKMESTHLNMCENEILVGVLTYKIYGVLERLKAEYVTVLLQKLLGELESVGERLKLIHKEPDDALAWTRGKVQSLMRDTKQVVDTCQKSVDYILGPLEALDNEQCYNAIHRVKSKNLHLQSLTDLINKLINE